jgi:purine-nucleoside phosphorylase
VTAAAGRLPVIVHVGHASQREAAGLAAHAERAGAAGVACVAPFYHTAPDVPGLVGPTVAGHRGTLAVGTWAGAPVVVCSGRVHFYEGHPWERVTRLVKVVAELGAKVLLLTNAAGGIRADLNPGDLMLLRGHLKLLDRDAWTRLGEIGNPYSPRLLSLLQQLDPALPTGVYAALTGPCYETPAEIRALAAAGADAVGMSTAIEAETATRLGLEVAAISTITNKAAGLGDGPLSHKEVEETAKLAVARLGRLVEQFVAAA